jgi:hypothetical protein
MRGKLLLAPAFAFCLSAFAHAPAQAQILRYSNVTDRPGGPGEGVSPRINNSGDIAFGWISGASSDVFFYDRSEKTFVDLLSLAGAPAGGWFPKINNYGDIVFIEPTSRDLWLFERRKQALTNLSTLPGYPGNTEAFGLDSVFDINDQDQISFHSGDRNTGDVYLYERRTGQFSNVSDRPGGPGRGRENAINNRGEIAYMGFPYVHVYDIATGATTLVAKPPGGAPGGSFELNDRGDLAFFQSGVVLFYDATQDTLLDLSTLPGYPPILQPSAGFENDVSDTGEITFWQDMVGLFYFEPNSRTFTLMTGQGIVPPFGMATSIDDFGEIALAAGQDVFLAEGKGTAPRLRLQINGARPEPAVVVGPGATHLTLDVKAGTSGAPLDWYYLVYLRATGEALWVTSRGITTTPAPLVAGTPAVDVESLPLLDRSFPPGTALTFGFFLLQGSSFVASDYLSTVVSSP